MVEHEAIEAATVIFTMIHIKNIFVVILVYYISSVHSKLNLIA